MVDKVTEAAVVGGVDTHKDLHVAAVVDQNNKRLRRSIRSGAVTSRTSNPAF